MEPQEDMKVRVVFVMKSGKDFTSANMSLADAEKHVAEVRGHVQASGFRGWRWQCGYLINMEDLSLVFCGTEKVSEARNDAP